MAIVYALKHMFRSWSLFLALLLGIILASAFFAGLDIKANATAMQAVESQLKYVYVDLEGSTTLLRPDAVLAGLESTMTVPGVAGAEVIARVYGLTSPSNQTSVMSSIQVVGIQRDSRAYRGWSNRPSSIGENETYILQGARQENNLTVGDTISVNFSTISTGSKVHFFTFNLTVGGVANLDDEASSIIGGAYSLQSLTTPGQYRGDSVLIVDFDSTMMEIQRAMAARNPLSVPITADLLFYLDRGALISPWDIQTSLSNVVSVQAQITNKMATQGISTYLQSPLSFALSGLSLNTIFIRFSLIVVSIPVFFMAWYVGTTVSDVSFNLRRREIGLLSTKGFSSGQMLSMFITEALVLGISGGLLGVLLAFLLNPLFTQFTTSVFSPQLIGPYTMVLSAIFGALIAFLSIYSSAKRASNLRTVDALREYLPMEETRNYKKKTVWLAFILGTYKIAAFASGVNMTAVLTNAIFTSGNFIVGLLGGLFMLLDQMLNYIGPLLFFWGFTKLFIQGSVRFQQVTTRVASFFGDLGALATKNVRRNPARIAAVAFLLALIVGYAVQVTIQQASENDFNVRTIYNRVGADINVPLLSVNNSSVILNSIVGNLSEKIASTTTEFSTGNILYAGGYPMSVIGIQPDSWLKTAYYENEWFSGADLNQAFSEAASDKNTILIDGSIANLMKLKVGDTLMLTSGSVQRTVRVIGFFSRPNSQQISLIFPSSTNMYSSMIPEQLLEDLATSYALDAEILVKVKSGIDSGQVADNIRALDLNVGQITSFSEEWTAAQSNAVIAGTADAQKLGIVFAVLAASVGTGLVSIVSMKERSREAAMMSVKGLSYKQLLIVFLSENLAVVLFSVILGLVVGFIAAFGLISSGNALIGSISVTSIVQHRFVVTLDSLLFIAGCSALIFASTIIPITVMARKYVTKLERMVRLR